MDFFVVWITLVILFDLLGVEGNLTQIISTTAAALLGFGQYISIWGQVVSNYSA